MYTEYDGFSVKKIVNGGLQNNSYIVKCGNKCVLIDPASKIVKAQVEEEGLEVMAVLLTHGHFDHIKGVAPFMQENVPVYIHKLDNPKCTGEIMLDWLKRFRIEPFSCDNFIEDGDVLQFDGLEIKVIHTPGHSSGGVSFVVKNVVFSGDTLFLDSYGRYDFEDSSFEALKNSIKVKLFGLPGDYVVLPGHGDSTTMQYERERNMILWS